MNPKALIEQNMKLRVVLQDAVLSDGGVSYDGPEDEVGHRACCGVVSYKPHEKDCWVPVANALLREQA
jgi:hypothetical protein